MQHMIYSSNYKKSFENEYLEIEKESRRYGLSLYKKQGFEVRI